MKKTNKLCVNSMEYIEKPWNHDELNDIKILQGE